MVLAIRATVCAMGRRAAVAALLLAGTCASLAVAQDDAGPVPGPYLGPVLGQAPKNSGPVLVELFTSQGCSSCPPADHLLEQLSARADVLPLSLHVDYWDYLGWADQFAAAAHTIRQKAYARAGGRRMIYTPQMVIMGREDVVGADQRAVDRAIGGYDGATAPFTMRLSGNRAALVLEADQGGLPEAEMFLVQYQPQAQVAIARGELAGRTQRYTNVVISLNPLGRVKGGAASQTIELPAQSASHLRRAVIVQAPGAGRVFLAARLP